ncbi:CaiB/BaiF CoA-transferase family protein [Paracoccus sp. J55]|uniref:CaiB/BaiF CoA transferase family protein n=1 Tax=Paracoccus sp. J55 TaxID=935849 RepID=UPI00048C8AD0|nr:CoA transferase [Paracoccus sp. J55]
MTQKPTAPQIFPTGPLAGLRVIEAAGYLAGPLCAQTLATLGAEVIKIEPPAGDAYRNVGHAVGGTGVMWTNANTGKKSVVLDLKTPEDLARLKTLIAGADVFIETWRPRVSAALGLGFNETSKLNPRLVQLSLTGYGPDGPLSAEPAYDAIIQGLVGLLDYEADGGKPRATNHFIADKVSAIYATQIILAAILQRERTGQGVHVETSMLDMIASYAFTDTLHNRTYLDDTADQTILPQPVVATSDGHIVLSPVTGKQLGRTLEAVGHPEWKDELKAIKGRRAMTEAFFAWIAEPISKKPSAHWLAAFRELDVPAGPILRPEAMLENPQLSHNRFFAELDSPAGRLRATRYPARFNGTLLAPRVAAPALGSDTAEVLASMESDEG